MNKNINLTVDENVMNEINECVIVHSDFLIDQNDSQTEHDVSLLLKSLPNDLRNLEHGFYMISENEIYNYIRHHVLVDNGYVESTNEQCFEYFVNNLFPSFEKHFPNVFSKIDYDNFYEYEINDENILNQIAEFASNKLIADSTISINDELFIIDTIGENKYSSNIHNVNFVEMFANEK